MHRVSLALAGCCLVVLAACGGGGESATLTPSPSLIQTPEAAAPSPTSRGASPTVPPEGLSYTVIAGDTLGGIAARFGVTVNAIVAANGIGDAGVLQVGQVLLIPGTDTPSATASPASAPPATNPPTQPPAATVGLLTLVDKQHALPEGYVPPGITAVPAQYAAPGYSARIRSDVMGAVAEMLDASGYDIRVVSGYRSYTEQVATFNYWVSVLGYDEALRVSAQAGHSEHQLGSTVDLGTAEYGWDLTAGFGATPAGQWLAANAHKYGFALSYPDGAEAVTGYAYEPWHFRYIGKAEAAAWKASGLTLNQYLGGL